MLTHNVPKCGECAEIFFKCLHDEYWDFNGCFKRGFSFTLLERVLKLKGERIWDRLEITLLRVDRKCSNLSTQLETQDKKASTS